MKKIDLQLEFNKIRERIEIDKAPYKPGKWAQLIGVSKTLVSNIHGRSKRQNPSLPYVFAVSRFTEKPIEWYLYGSRAPAVMLAEPLTRYEGSCSFCGSMTEDVKDLCKKIKDIVESEHQTVMTALIMSIEACHKQLDDIRKLTELAEHRRKLLDPDIRTGTGKDTRTGSRKKTM
jgi:hypothetical protein